MNIIKIEENKNNLVIKHQDLVWEARYRLSELGIKVVSVLISMIKIDDKDFQQYILKVSDFKELIGSDSKNTYDYTHRLIKELLSKTLKIGDKQFAWISYGEYVEGSDIVIFEINRHLKPYLLALQGKFIKYNIVNILPLRSAYVIRLYELLKSKWSEYKSYNKNAQSYSFELKIDWLRKHFDIPTSYQYSSHIKKLIINKAKKQFEAKTDIQFTYKEQKIGRKVDRLIVTVKDNNRGGNSHLRTERTFIAYLKEKYKGTGNLFFVNNIEINNKKSVYFFGINDKNLVYAVPFTGGDNITVTKEKAEKILKICYDCAIHSELYRELIDNKEDLWSLYREDLDFFNTLINNINATLKDIKKS